MKLDGDLPANQIIIHNMDELPDIDQSPQKLQTHSRTWYGLEADIIVTESNIHLVKLPKISLPHPGVVNWFSRQGLQIDTRLELTARHEFGHLQTLPVPFLHLLFIFWPRRGKPFLTSWSRFWMILLSHQMVWEVASESYVVSTDRRAVSAPRPNWARGLYAVFWGATAVFSLLGTLLLLKRDE